MKASLRYLLCKGLISNKQARVRNIIELFKVEIPISFGEYSNGRSTKILLKRDITEASARIIKIFGKKCTHIQYYHIADVRKILVRDAQL